MATLNNGNPLDTSTDYVVANPDFANERTKKVLAQTTNTPTGLEQGATSVPYGYYDGAGIWRETTSNHTIQNSVVSKSINVPASFYQTTVLNVGARFAR